MATFLSHLVVAKGHICDVFAFPFILVYPYYLRERGYVHCGDKSINTLEDDVGCDDYHH